jgi:hypothetical protein
MSWYKRQVESCIIIHLEYRISPVSTIKPDEPENKTLRSSKLLDCNFGELKMYLESKFLPGMTWDNYGEWHIDHIKPCAIFDLTDLEQRKQCFHYSNLQPLWAIDNIKKGAKYGRAS